MGRKKTIIAVILVLVVALITGCGQSEAEKLKQEAITVENSPPTLVTMPSVLARMYKTNHLRAEELFENKIILVIGRAVEIARYEKAPDWLYIDMGIWDDYQIRADFRDVHIKDLQTIVPKKTGFVVKGRCWLDKEHKMIFISGAKIVPPDHDDIVKVKPVDY